MLRGLRTWLARRLEPRPLVYVTSDALDFSRYSLREYGVFVVVGRLDQPASLESVRTTPLVRYVPPPIPTHLPAEIS